MLVEELGRRAEEISAQLRALKLQEAEARGKLGAAPGAPIGNKNAQGTGNIVRGGTSMTYTYRRLLRDRPDLAEQVKAGKVSANKAAIEAGFRKKPTPFEQVQNLLPKLDNRRRRRRADPPRSRSLYLPRRRSPCTS